MSFELDHIDRSILTQLQINARMSDREISRIIHLSPNAVTKRIKRLEDENYILQYTTVLNKSMVNRKLECLTGINLTRNNFFVVNSFIEYTRSIPEVYCTYYINGIFDFLIHIVAIDIQDYYSLVVNKFHNLNCVGDVTTLVILSEVAGFNKLDLSHLNKHNS